MLRPRAFRGDAFCLNALAGAQLCHQNVAVHWAAAVGKDAVLIPLLGRRPYEAALGFVWDL